MVGATAVAQPQLLVRERQERQLVAPGSPSEPVPEVRVAANIATTLVFNAPIDKASVEVEGRATRFRLVDVGERTLFLEPIVAPGEGERLGLRVRYRDGTPPVQATFALVSHPTLVDTRVDVVRGQRAPEVLEAALAQCEAGGLANLVLSGRLDLNGVRAQRIKVVEDVQAGLRLHRGNGFRADSWALVSVRVQNLPGQPPWTAGDARLIRGDGTPVKVLSVRMDKARLSAGETGWVIVETGPPSWVQGEVLSVEVDEKGGDRRLVIGAAVL